MMRVMLAVGLCVTLGLQTAWAAGSCDGDCNADGTISVDELVRGVNIALGSTAPSQCANFDANHDSKVTVDELVIGVNGALNGCAYLGAFYGTAALSGGRSAILNLTAQATGDATGTVRITDGAGGSSLFVVGDGDGEGEAAVTIGTAGLSGSVDLDTGAFSIDGSVILDGTTFPIHISGTFPGLNGGSASFSGQIGEETFSGSIVSGDGSTPTPTRTRPPTATATPTPTVTRTSVPATVTPIPTNTNPPQPTATPTTSIVPPGISAQLLGIWSGQARNDSTGENKQARIKIEVKGGQVVVTDLANNLWQKALTVSIATPTALYYNHVGSSVETLQVALAPNGLLGGTYSTTTLSFPPTVHALALVLTKES